MNKEVSLKSDLKMFNIDIDDIEFAPNFSEVLQEAIAKMREETLLKNLEVVLNNNLIEAGYKPTNYRTILGCRVSYADLEKSVSFIVRPDEKPSYEYLEQQCRKQKEVIDKANKYLHTRGIQRCYNGKHYRGLDGLQVQVLEDILKEVQE